MKALRPTYKATLLLICLLFLLWGLAMNLMNSLNTSVAYYLNLDGTNAALMQLFYYLAYAAAAIPAALISHRFGFKGGIISSLAIFAIGCLLALPAAETAKAYTTIGFCIFLIALFVMSLGSAGLEANCNPYVTRLGDAKSEAGRINLANAFNGLGSILGPLLLSFFVTAVASDPYQATHAAGQFLEDKLQFLGSLKVIYGGMAGILVLLIIVFSCIKLPHLPCEIDATSEERRERTSFIAPFRHPHYVLGLFALFLYCGIQLSGMTFVGWFAQEEVGMSLGASAFLVGISSLALTAGRFISVLLLRRMSEYKLLSLFMCCAALVFALACILSLAGLGMIGLACYICAFFFCSVGYATTFSIALRGLHKSELKIAGALLVTCMLGGGVFTVVLSVFASLTNYAIVLLAYVPARLYISWYARRGAKIGVAQEDIDPELVVDPL